MQVTDSQVAQSIEALRRTRPPQDLAAEIHGADEDEVPPEVLAALEAVPAIRRDRTDGARSRLARSGLPSDDEVADKLVGRLVCDRLR